MLNTHGVTLGFGRHQGELLTRVPVSYLRWMVNQHTQQSDLARAEIDRRGSKLPQIEISGHAIDRASLRCSRIWRESRDGEEGLYSWLERMTLEAIQHGAETKSGKIEYRGMYFVVEQGEEYPVLKSIMQHRRSR